MSSRSSSAAVVSPAPFIGWVSDQLEHQERVTLVARFGWLQTMSEDSALRKLHRWTHETRELDWLDVYEALVFADAAWWEIYPEKDRDERHGRNRFDRVDRGRSYVATEETLLKAHAMYSDGMSLRAVARELFDECFAASEKSLAMSFWTAFTHRGWEVRSKGEASSAANRRRAFRPQCSHVHQMGENRGDRCSKSCVGNDKWCWKHNPEQIAKFVARIRPAAIA